MTTHGFLLAFGGAKDLIIRSVEQFNPVEIPCILLKIAMGAYRKSPGTFLSCISYQPQPFSMLQSYWIVFEPNRLRLHTREVSDSCSVVGVGPEFEVECSE